MSPISVNRLVIDSEVANDLHSTANAAVPAGFAGLPTAERSIGNLEINKKVQIECRRARSETLRSSRQLRAPAINFLLHIESA
jgi:hypothetical protein